MTKTANPATLTLTINRTSNVSDRQRASRLYFSGSDLPGVHLLKAFAPAIMVALGLPSDTPVKADKDKDGTRFLVFLADAAPPRTFQVEGVEAAVAQHWGQPGKPGVSLDRIPAKVATEDNPKG